MRYEAGAAAGVTPAAAPLPIVCPDDRGPQVTWNARPARLGRRAVPCPAIPSAGNELISELMRHLRRLQRIQRRHHCRERVLAGAQHPPRLQRRHPNSGLRRRRLRALLVIACAAGNYEMFKLRGAGTYAAATFGFAVARLSSGPGMLGRWELAGGRTEACSWPRTSTTWRLAVLGRRLPCRPVPASSAWWLTALNWCLTSGPTGQAGSNCASSRRCAQRLTA